MLPFPFFSPTSVCIYSSVSRSLCTSLSLMCLCLWPSVSLCLCLLCLSVSPPLCCPQSPLSHSGPLSPSLLLSQQTGVTPHSKSCNLGGTNNSSHMGKTWELAKHFHMLLSPSSRCDPEAQRLVMPYPRPTAWKCLQVRPSKRPAIPASAHTRAHQHTRLCAPGLSSLGALWLLGQAAKLNTVPRLSAGCQRPSQGGPGTGKKLLNNTAAPPLRLGAFCFFSSLQPGFLSCAPPPLHPLPSLFA